MDKNAFFAAYKLWEDDLIEADISWDERSLTAEDYHSERSVSEVEESAHLDNMYR